MAYGKAPAWQTEELADEWPSDEVSMSIDAEDGEDVHSVADSSSDSGVEWPTADDEDGPAEMSFTAAHGTPSAAGPSAADTFVDRAEASANVGTFVDRGSANVGTFVIHEGIGGVGRTPGKAMLQKDFFTPLKLERMFEPPSPPPGPQESDIQKRYLTPVPPSDLRPSTNISPPPSGPFTFHCAPPPAESTPLPHLRPPHSDKEDGAPPAAITTRPTPKHVSSPANPPVVPSTPQNKHLAHVKAGGGGTPLKLFQFTYDTYTREHLSALVDSIGIAPGTASGSGTTPEGQEAPIKRRARLSRAKGRSSAGSRRSSEVAQPETPILRSAKRVKLSPISDFEGSENVEVRITRPSGRRWSGEGRRMMESLKKIDWSTVSSRRSTVGEPQLSTNLGDHYLPRRRSFDEVEDEEDSDDVADQGASTSREGGVRRYANLRNEAANLMAAIKKRVFSGGSDVEASYYHDPPEDEEDEQTQSQEMPSEPTPVSDRPIAPNPSGGYLRVPSHSSTATASSSNPSRTFSATSHSSSTTQTTQTSQQTGQSQAVQSVGSYTKHAGPPVMRTIRPCDVDVEQLLAATGRMGDMVFDRNRGRWVSITGQDGHVGDISGFSLTDESEEREDSRPHEAAEHHQEQNAPAAYPDIDDDFAADEGEVVAEHSLNVVEGFDGDDLWSPSYIASELDEDEDTARNQPPSRSPSPLGALDEHDDEDATQRPRPAELNGLLSSHLPAQTSSSPSTSPEPVFNPPTGQTFVTPSSSSTSLDIQKTPSRSVLKTPSQTLYNYHHRSRRSVSFSDGRREGPIRGLGLGDSATTITSGSADSAVGDGEAEDEWECIQDGQGVGDGESAHEATSHSEQEMLSVRTRRIEQMLKDQEATETLDGFELNFGVGLPPDSRCSSRSHHRRSSGVALHASVKSSASARSAMSAMPSFLLTHDALLGALTDVEPFTAYWDRLVAVDLSWPFTCRRVDGSSASFSQVNGDVSADNSMISHVVPSKQTVSALPPLTSLARLDEFVPQIIKLDVSRNQVEYLTGVPAGLKELMARETLLGSTDGGGGVTGVGASWARLKSLERLDLEGCRARSVEQFSSLTHLTHLNLAKNKITSIHGLEGLRRLISLDLRGNRIRQVDFSRCEWGRVEELRLSGNGMRSCQGLWRVFEAKALTSITTLDLEDNQLGELDFSLPSGASPSSKSKLRVLRASGNKLTKLDVSALSGLRTLYADRNRLAEVLLPGGATCKVEVLSLRYQEVSPKASLSSSSTKIGKSRGGLRVPVPARDAKRVYMSGTLKPPVLSRGIKCYALTYLEVAGCGLVGGDLEGLSSLLPNIRTLNVNYNHFEDGLGFLQGLERVRRVSAVGCGVRRVRGIVDVLSAAREGEEENAFPELQVLDVRGNPCVAGWYLPLTTTTPGAGDGEGEVGPSSSSTLSYTELDIPYRRSLPNKAYAGRLAYRGLVMGGCPSLRVLDGVIVTRKEREKAGELVRRLGVGSS